MSFHFWLNFVSFSSGICTIIVSSITLFFFLTKRQEIGYFAKSILNSLLHITMYHIDNKIKEAKESIEKEDYEKAELKIQEIIGTIEGDKLLNKNLLNRIKIISKVIDDIKTKTDFKKQKGNLIKILTTIQQELKSIEFNKIQGINK